MRLLVDISPHGFGHAAQTVAVINALQQRIPDVDVVIQTTVPRYFFQNRLTGSFRYVARSNDFGLRMHSALAIDLERSAAAYAEVHANWPERVDAETRWIESQYPDLVLSNVSYLTLAGAQAAGIPALAMCSLNWAAIYRYYFSDRQEADGILRQMLDAYNAADKFLCPQPSMPMPELDNIAGIGCLAGLGRERRDEINSRLGISEGDRLVLVSLGGTQSEIAALQWPAIDGVQWIMPDNWVNGHSDRHGFSELHMPFTDVLRSSDAMLGKCGYGTVSECACNATPLIYIPRPEWPEEQVLLDWLKVNGCCEPLAPDLSGMSSLDAVLDHCRSVPRVAPPEPVGAEEAARYIIEAAEPGR